MDGFLIAKINNPRFILAASAYPSKDICQDFVFARMKGFFMLFSSLFGNRIKFTHAHIKLDRQRRRR